MKIFVDADAHPNMIKEILFRAADRLCIPLIFVANQYLKVPQSPYISSMAVTAAPDAADDEIVKMLNQGDLVITADLPLADRVINKGGYVINPRGTLYTQDNIKEKLAMRDLMDELRNGGLISDGPSPFSRKDRQAFANQLDRLLTKYCKNSE